ncbi:MAG: hypothetical protein JW836_05195 [Deltaproteobacteria bacterium]|nr:hypothetical protein [Deltaproteobacteria bacterium]
MKDIHPELRTVIGALHLEEGPGKLLIETVAGKETSPHAALQLIWLVEDLRAKSIPNLILLQKKGLLENVLNLIRQGHKEWVGRVCHLLYERRLPKPGNASLLPAGMIRDLLEWVKREKAEKVREILWAVLLRKRIGLEEVAKAADLAPALCETDPITRNNAVRFLFDHFTPEEVVESLFHFSILTGRSVPGLAYRRYVSLLKAQGALLQNIEIVKRILCSGTLDDQDIQRIFLEYVNGLNRFDLVRLFSSPDSAFPRLPDLRRKGAQLGFLFDVRKTLSPHHGSFRSRCSLLTRTGCR